MPRKTPLSVYLDPSLLRDLDAFAAERRKPRSLVIEAAIRSFLTPDDVDAVYRDCRKESEYLAELRLDDMYRSLRDLVAEDAGEM